MIQIANKKVHDLDLNRDFLNPVGKAIADQMFRSGITLVQLAQVSRTPLNEWREIMFDIKPIAPSTARILEQLFGVPTAEWLKLQKAKRRKRT